MKYLQDDSGNVLPIPDAVYLFKRTVSFLTWAIRGDFSTDFTVPNDSETRKTLGYSSINQLNRTTQKAFSFYSNGNVIADGRVFIKGAGTSFELFFVSGNTNWMNLITGSIKDLDLSEYNISFDAPTIDSRKNATEGVIFPVIDWYSNYRKLTNTFVVKPVTGISIDTMYELYPCFHEKTIFEKIFATYGLKVSGNLLDDPIYKDLVITPEALKSAAYASAISGVFQSMDGAFSGLGTFTPAKLRFDSGTDYFDDTNDRLTFPDGGAGTTLTYSFDRTGGSGAQTGGTATVQLRKNGVTISSFTLNPNILSGSNSIKTDLSPGDYIEMYASPNGYYIAHVEASYPEFLTANQVVVENILPDVDQFSFVKHIATRFNCLVDFDPFTQTVIFTKLDSLKKSEAQDLSQNVVSYKPIPLSGYGKNNYIRAQEADELSPYKTEDLNYGDSLVTSDGDDNREVFTTPFRPAETFTNPRLEWLITSVPLVRLEDADDGLEYFTVADIGGGQTEFQNGVFFGDYKVGAIIRIESESGEYSGFAVVEEADASGLVALGVRFGATDAGKIFLQKIVFPFAGSRELIVVRATDVNNFNAGSPIYGDQNIRIVDEDGTYPYATVAWAFYAKPNIGTALDQVRVGLNYGPVLGTGNIPFGDLYHKNLRKIIKGARLEAVLLLSETEYNNLVLAGYFFLRTHDVTGYFLISSIDGYTDKKTPITVQLTLMD